jgi:hypothetical protein
VNNVAEEDTALQCGESCWPSHKIHCRDSPVNEMMLVVFGVMVLFYVLYDLEGL